MKHNNTNPQSGDVYCNTEETSGKYYAYQLIEVKKGDITYLLLDYFDEKIPSEEDLKTIEPFRNQRWFF